MKMNGLPEEMSRSYRIHNKELPPYTNGCSSKDSCYSLFHSIPSHSSDSAVQRAGGIVTGRSPITDLPLPSSDNI